MEDERKPKPDDARNQGEGPISKKTKLVEKRGEGKDEKLVGERKRSS